MNEVAQGRSEPRPLSPNDITPVGVEDPSRFLNRDLQWLEFNRRVLAQALDPRNPLLERVRFLAIFGSNLDEFFMKRLGGLRRQIDAGVGSPPWEPLSPAEQLALIRARVVEQPQRIGVDFRPPWQSVAPCRPTLNWLSACIVPSCFRHQGRAL